MITLGELQSSVLYAWQNPYVRRERTTIGYPLERKEKSRVKKVFKERARLLSATTHYVVDNDVLDVIIPSFKNKNRDRFIRQAFWEANPRHDNMFIEFDFEYLRKQFGESELLHYFNDSPKIGGIWISKPSHVKVSQVSPRESEDFRANGWKKRMVHDYRFFYSSEDKFVDTASFVSTSAYITPDIPILKLSPSELEDEEETLNTYRFFFSARNDVLSDDDLLIVPHVVQRIDTCLDAEAAQLFITSRDQVKLQRDNYVYTEAQEGFMAIATAIMALMNYPWVVTDEEGVNNTHTKSVRTENIGDVYRTVKLTVPKEKAVLKFQKHIKRTRKFGNKEHEVVGHWRTYQKTGETIWIAPYTRGDAKLGTVYKDYEVKRA